jgi:hypothetical protein
MTSRTSLLLLLVLCLSSCAKIRPLARPPSNVLQSPLANLAAAHAGRAMHESSWDRSGGNADMRRVEPGQTLTILDYHGAGIIRRFWVTIAPRADKLIHRQAILRMYWDEAQTPCVEAPIGDFFGVGFGEQRDYISLPLNETSGGYNCYWPMPFHKHARWTITNMSGKPIDAFYYNIDFTAYDSVPADLRHLHAQWRRENPTDAKRNYTILEATGQGHFVGCALFMQAIKPRGLGFLEGDEMIHIDGVAYQSPDINATQPVRHYFEHPTTRPQVNGTGTEDYFSSGWYFDRGLYSAPYHGVVIKDDPPGRVSAYRWHIEDAMPFNKSIRVTIEHGHNNDHIADYSSIAFYYQNEPHVPAPPMPADAAALLPAATPPVKHLPNAIEGEALAAASKASAGNIHTQSMYAFGGEWSGDGQLFWTDGQPEATLTIPLTIPAAAEYRITGYFTKAPDYAVIECLMSGQRLRQPIDLYSPRVEPTGPIALGTMRLEPGTTPLVLKIAGKNAQSANYYVGVDALVLRARPASAPTTR